MSNDHRLCEYCRENFYSDDELFIHMRDRHEQCHICKARGGEAERWKYFRDYTMLVSGTALLETCSRNHADSCFCILVGCPARAGTSFPRRALPLHDA